MRFAEELPFNNEEYYWGVESVIMGLEMALNDIVIMSYVMDIL